jgi:hypothetical protein
LHHAATLVAAVFLLAKVMVALVFYQVLHDFPVVLLALPT